MRIPKVIALIVASLHFLAAGMPDEKCITATKQTQFIRKLFDQKRYFECIAETRRLAFLYPHHTEDTKNALRYFIAVNYFLGGQYLSAAKVVDEELPTDYVPGRILLSQALKKTEHARESLQVLDNLASPSDDPLLRYEYLVRKTDALIAIEKYDEAARELASQEKFFSSAKLREFSMSLTTFQKETPYRPYHAALYSAAFPGLGQAYAGKYFDGLLSLAAVFLTGFATVHYYRQGDDALAAFFASFSIIFYAGNIYGGYNSAVAANRAAFQKKFDAEITPHIPPYDPLRIIEIPGIVP